MRLKMQEIDLITKIAFRKKTKLAEGVENVKTDCRNLVPFQYMEDWYLLMMNIHDLFMKLLIY